MGNEEGHFAASADMPESGAVPDSPDLPGETTTEAGANTVEEARRVAPWHVFLQTANADQIKARFAGEVSEILKSKGMENVCVLGLLEPRSSIDSTDLDRVFSGFSQLNPDRTKDVVLILLSRGGSVRIRIPN